MVYLTGGLRKSYAHEMFIEHSYTIPLPKFSGYFLINYFSMDPYLRVYFWETEPKMQSKDSE